MTKFPRVLAWSVISVWVLSYAVRKAFQANGVDIDGAEQVYFAQSWQMGYGQRQPPLYTWLILALKPGWLAWTPTLEIARYAVLLLWLGGVQALSKVCGAAPATQARVLLAHLGLLLVMWRVHDSLTHTVLAAAIVTWGSAAVILALARPRWWALVGLLAALACLAKLNAVVWCVSSLVAALVLIGRMASRERDRGSATPSQHLRWLLIGGLLCMSLVGPYLWWWLAQRAEPVSLAENIMMADHHESWWGPSIDVASSTVEYLAFTPLVLGVLTWCLRRRGGALPVQPLAGLYINGQAVIGVLMLAGLSSAMQASHFTTRWLWPVLPGLTVWFTMRALARAELLSRSWQRAVDAVMWAGVLLAMVMSMARWWEPWHTAQHCRNCWTDRPAGLISQALHARYGQPLRFITGDDHLAGLLAYADGRDMSWTAVSPDLPPPVGFAAAKAACVAVWVDVGHAGWPAIDLAAIMAPAGPGPVDRVSLPLQRAPQRSFWVQSRLLPSRVCDQAPR